MADIANPDYPKCLNEMVETLRNSDERLRLVVESTFNAILMINPAGLIEIANAQAERLFGYPRRELLGSPVEMLVPERFRGRHPGPRALFLADPQAHPMGDGRELHCLRKDGSEFPVEIGLNPIATKEGELVVSTIIDISERNQKEERIQDALRDKDVLLSEAYHRVKNNLQVIDSLLELQSARIADPVVLSILRDSQNRIRSMALIHQTLYRSEDFSEVNFADFLNTLAPILMSSYGIGSDRIRLLIDTPTVMLPISSAIPCGLIVNELMSNALKHAFPDKQRGSIGLSLIQDDQGHIVLSFTDDGVGIPAELDLDKSATLGLQLIALLADQLHGTLRIDRADPTRFVLRFPLQL